MKPTRRRRGIFKPSRTMDRLFRDHIRPGLVAEINRPSTMLLSFSPEELREMLQKAWGDIFKMRRQVSAYKGLWRKSEKEVRALRLGLHGEEHWRAIKANK